MHNKKPEISRLNLFYILQVLSRYTDEEHPLTAGELAEKVNGDFGHLSAADAVVSTDTVKRTLEDLISYVFPEDVDDGALLYEYGYYLHAVMKSGKSFVPYREAEGGQSPRKYYYLENDLRPAEILTLKDAVETYSYFSEEDITELVRKLQRLCPYAFSGKKYHDVAKNDRDEDSLVIMNIEDLNQIIRNKNAANITYCAYDVNKKLVPRPGYPRVIEPLHLMWSNGYYYLLAYSAKYDGITNLRVDRITEIEEVVQENTRRTENFNPVQYRHEHPVMYGGEKVKIELLCRDTGRNYIMNTIMDVFGRKAVVKPAGDDLLMRYLHNDAAFYAGQGISWLKVTLESSVGGVELWATQYCVDCLVISPQTLADRVRERLGKGLGYYAPHSPAMGEQSVNSEP